MADANPSSEPPLVTRVEPPARPGLADAVVFTLAYGVVVFGSMIAIVGAALLGEWILGDPESLRPNEGAAPGSVEALPPSLATALGIAVVAGYSAGIGFTVLVFRRVVGRNWTREVGLLRPPLVALVIAAVAFPGFTVASDLLAAAVYSVSGMDASQAEAAKGLGDLLRSFHWSFAVLAVGICPGVAEELWCRGFLGRGLVARYGLARGVVLTSLFFGLLHLYPLPYVAITAIMGAALHFTYLASRSLWVPILIHALNNSYAGLVAAGTVTDPLPGALALRPAAVAAAAIAVLAAGGLGLWCTRPRRAGDRIRILWVLPPAACSLLLLWFLFA